jgi:transcription-repair coupling factor (superfamily II helicase)
LTHPAVRDLLEALARHPGFQDLLHHLQTQRASEFHLSGTVTTAKAIYLALLWQRIGRPLVVITPDGRRAEELTSLLATFFVLLGVGDGRAQTIPAPELLPGAMLEPGAGVAEERAAGLFRLAQDEAAITVTPVASALLRTESAEFYRRLALTLRVNEDLPLDDLSAHLESVGYQRREPVEMEGEYSIRGGIVDIFPVEDSSPVRLEFFGDTIESIRRFNPATQRSTLKVEECRVLPMRESRAGEAERRSSLLEIAPRALVVLDEPEQSRAAAERLLRRFADWRDAAGFLAWEEFEAQARARERILLRELEMEGDPTPGALRIRIGSRAPMRFHGNMAIAVAEARTLVEQGNRVLFVAASTGEVERLAEVFGEYAVPYQLGLDPRDGVAPYLAERAYFAGTLASVLLAKGFVRSGVVLPESKTAIFGADDLFDASELVARPAPSTKGVLSAFTADLADLNSGDFIVHATHGIGRFLGVREIEHGEQKGDFMLLEYAGGAKLYVPLARMDLVQRYRGAGEVEPALDRLGGVSWEKTKARVKARMRDMAEELLRLYAERKTAEGFRYSPDSNWQREFEEAFEFTETRDQLSATADIKRDMESATPMDRLLCGDVGFGKTEIAMRAAFKALGDGKQVAVLAPTTVLCFQHFETFRRRFAPFPVRVEMLSRFRSKQEIAAVLADLSAGKVDIVIGTHRLLSKDVEFRDLGLLIVDEEQRFGVRHKERLKQLRKNVDALTMTATPIPRTLHMAMLGLRDLSVIETPPKDRLAIHTMVAHFQPELIRAAIEQEIGRGGQVYFLHNRVESIWSRAAQIQELVPEARLGVGHGQMDEAALEKVMLGFMRHEFDVLVATTIVENGLDIPLANTIVIENAERYGLSEIYQLRGRVGRSNRRAYAYLLVPPDAELTEVARQRLAALREFSELGAGFKIAALDLELRGGGNLLGGEQHGHIDAVGYDTYVRLLEQTVQELRGEAAVPEIHSTISLGLDLRIPSDYIGDEHQRLRAYKRIAEASDPESEARVREELEDRYGRAPEAVAHLLRFATLKSVAERLGIESIERRAGVLNVKFHAASAVDPARLMRMVETNPGARFTPAGVLRLPLPADGVAATLVWIEDRLRSLDPPGRATATPAPAPRNPPDTAA